jgi:hypothetical protein
LLSKGKWFQAMPLRIQRVNHDSLFQRRDHARPVLN